MKEVEKNWIEAETYLKSQEVEEDLIRELKEFRNAYSVDELVKERVAMPEILFYGKDILEMSVASLLQGDHLLLSGAKATGKNVLCETLAWLFGRPQYDISFHVNMDSASLIGTDTFVDNEVRLRKGPIYQCAEFGGFGILDKKGGTGGICRVVSGSPGKGIPWGNFHKISGPARPDLCRKSDEERTFPDAGNPHGNREQKL